jgi:hypothetical protein
VIILITVLFLLGMENMARAEDPSVSRYFPLAIGNRWVYEVQDRMDGAPPAEERWEVIREDQGAFVLRIRQSDLTTGGFEESFLPVVDGIKRFTRETKDTEHPPFFLKGPLRVGATWKDEDGRYEITALNKTVTVPAGVFTQCLEVANRRKGGKATIITLYAPGVGVVQREETFPIIEGSGSFYPQRQDKAILRLREWRFGGAVSLGLLSLHGGHGLPLSVGTLAPAFSLEKQVRRRGRR